MGEQCFKKYGEGLTLRHKLIHLKKTLALLTAAHNKLNVCTIEKKNTEHDIFVSFAEETKAILHEADSLLQEAESVAEGMLKSEDESHR